MFKENLEIQHRARARARRLARHQSTQERQVFNSIATTHFVLTNKT